MLKDNKKYEEELNSLKEQKIYYDKFLLTIESIILTVTLFFFILVVSIASSPTIPEDIGLIIVIISTVFLIIMCLVMLKIEQVAGYYECNKCHHKYVPRYKTVLLSMHTARTRYMKCPECHKYSWSRKVLQKDDK